jgi:hypothetical protein
MKIKKLLFFLPVLSLVITSCSSDEPTPEPVVEPPVVVAPVPQKLVSYDYPYHENIGIRRDKETYEYDSENRIAKVSFGGAAFGITYVSSDLIEVNQLEDNLTGYKVNSKSSIHLKEGSVELIVKREIIVSETKEEVFSVSTDSTVFTYKNKYLSKTQTYQKNNYFPVYRVINQADFEEQNGNITKATVKLLYPETTYIIDYTYDTEAYVNGSDYTYETPLIYSYNLWHFILHDKMGKKSTNNIIKMDHSYPETKPGIRSFKTMTLRRKLDTEKRLQEIVISGTVFDGATGDKTLEYKDAKGTFTYK